jgi:hypothetical protein
MTGAVCKQVTVCPDHIWTTLYIKYLQFLPTCFSPKDHHQGNVYNEHRDTVTDYTYMLLCGVWLY